ncbi:MULTISPECIES: Spx/MgsR family RNA polymerase-binding regulatory protein [unclassified Cyanobium]|uniref:Spx/MgsR family RNA polymerase-binding regulatory protein n=1 Tax=unclassified Cyanobium TaxID=2627006 RepID=UPI0020CF3911|nr:MULTISPECIES: Spx/MgsR family RNA polymerase-binding regulatory protein [unclassified Cyanobium]MCP9832909.1 Spx/MgsR family RNA polymerase-binding regulatory protein [Cyanobium sp. La Preciosa 7G6]MCP9935659.1 Spx/MgsR family RNA polymerase-binding regulatory protein [Cyanobium sp. Aljojuca 7A6]
MADPAVHRLFQYASCSTCRKALAWMRDRQIPFEAIDITTSPPSLELLSEAHGQLGGFGRLFNTSGQSYRALGAATVKAMDTATALAALGADGRLIKRPFLVTASGRILTGFRPEEWQELLG